MNFLTRGFACNKMGNTEDKIINFLEENEVSFTVPGCYNLPSFVVKDSIKELLEYGESDLIKKHKKWTWGCWELSDFKNNRSYFSFESKYWTELLKLKKFWDDEEDIELLKTIIATTIKKEEISKTYRYRRKGGFTKKLKERCLKRDNYKCVKCGLCEKLEIDHIIELIDGGENELKNLQTLCKTCHKSKTNKERAKRKQ